MDNKLLKTIGLATTIVGVGTTVLNSWVEDKKRDEKIKAEVDKVVTERLSEDKES